MRKDKHLVKLKYTESLENIFAENLQGFFIGWLNQPSPQVHLEILKNSNEIILAIDEDTNRVVGFITAITDKVLSAYIPFLEVLPEYQKHGIGQELIHRMLNKLHEYYMIDLLCDENLQTFYEKLGMKKAKGMMIRNYQNQSGKS